MIRIEDAPLYSWNPQWSPVGTRIAFFDDSGLRTLRAGPSEALERREVRVLLQKAIEDLSPIYREVLVLRDIEELSIEETAGVLAISISSVKVRLHRARIMVQKELTPKLKLASRKERRWLSWY